MPGMASPSSVSDAKLKQAYWCVYYGAGIIATLVLYGLMQERIMTKAYGGEMFTVSPFLVLCNRIFNCMYAGGMMVANKEEFGHKAPWWKYIVISISNVLATTCQYESLKYVSFPVQMLGKSFKMMPVMLWGIVIAGKRFGSVDWAVAACVTFGVTEFLMTGPMTSSKNHAENSSTGLLLLAGFLAFDGLTSTFQEKLFKDHPSSKFNMMLYVNMFSSVVAFASVFSSGNMGGCLAFCMAHGDFVANVVLLSSAAAGSQYFIYSMVKEFGALVFAATMNVRQVASILVSYATYEHSITRSQVVGLMFVFSALFTKSYDGLCSQRAKSDEDEKEPLMQKQESDPFAEPMPEPRASA